MSNTTEPVASAATVQPLKALTAMAHVADVQRSIEFYRKLGFVVKNTFVHQGLLRWAWLQSGGADLMIALTGRPMNPGAQDVLFYLYAPNVEEYRRQLAEKGLTVGEMKYPFYSPRGEFRVDDPDGWCLMIAHAG